MSTESPLGVTPKGIRVTVASVGMLRPSARSGAGFGPHPAWVESAKVRASAAPARVIGMIRSSLPVVTLVDRRELQRRIVNEDHPLCRNLRWWQFEQERAPGLGDYRPAHPVRDILSGDEPVVRGEDRIAGCFTGDEYHRVRSGAPAKARPPQAVQVRKRGVRAGDKASGAR